MIEGLPDNAPQRGLAEAGHGGIHGGEALGQALALGIADFWVHHFVAEKAVADFADGADAFAYGELFLLAGVEMDKAQVQHAAGLVADLGNQLAARAELDFLMRHFAFHLAGYAHGRVFDRGDMGFVFVAQGQVQHGVPQAADMQLGELAGGGVGELELLFEIGAHGKGYLKRTEWVSAKLKRGFVRGRKMAGLYWSGYFSGSLHRAT